MQGEVLKYVNVIATPLVLQEEQHPPTWTHAFKDYFSVSPTVLHSLHASIQKMTI